MNNQYHYRHIKDNSYNDKIESLFHQVFKGEGVDKLSVIATNHMPALKSWHLIEDREQVISALTQIEWNISIGGIPLKVWEQGIVGTLPSYRGQGLVEELNDRLDRDAENHNVDMILIQGIPDYYHRFGYRFSIEMENHINLPLQHNHYNQSDFRKATTEDINLFLDHDRTERDEFFIRSHRSNEDWYYQMTYGVETEYDSEVYVYRELYYIKIHNSGFGNGLIISELSETLNEEQLNDICSFLSDLAREKDKPYLRFNLPINSRLSREIQNRGVEIENTYGWQVKILNYLNFLQKMTPILERRLKNSSYNSFCGSINLFIKNQCYIIEMDNSKVISIQIGNGSEDDMGVTIPKDLMEPLILGHRSWRRLHDCRPDMYIHSKEAGKLVDILFPEECNWIYSIW